jgi:hypothetical protein
MITLSEGRLVTQTNIVTMSQRVRWLLTLVVAQVIIHSLWLSSLALKEGSTQLIRMVRLSERWRKRRFLGRHLYLGVKWSLPIIRVKSARAMFLSN